MLAINTVEIPQLDSRIPAQSSQVNPTVANPSILVKVAGLSRQQRLDFLDASVFHAVPQDDGVLRLRDQQVFRDARRYRSDFHLVVQRHFYFLD